VATTPYTDFLKEVLPFVPGCPRSVAINAIRNAVIEFCSDTEYWQETLDAVSLSASSLPYTIPAPNTDAMYTNLLRATVDGYPLDEAPMDVLDMRVPGWQSQTGAPRAWYQNVPGELRLYPIPPDTDPASVVLRVAYQPTRTSSGVDERIWLAYAEEISAGALQRLMDMPSKPWSNETSAKKYDDKFSSAKVIAAIEAKKSWTRKAMQVQMRRI